jgi:predicted nucleic acid-binding protein
VRFLLDTNVVSEWVKPQPNAGVVAWLSGIDESAVFLSVITLMELRYGIDCLPAGARRARLDKWLQEQLPLRFDDRVLQIDSAVANACGTLMARGKASGRTMAAMDAFIGATVLVHGLKLVTRNVADFKSSLGAAMIVNPWLESS